MKREKKKKNGGRDQDDEGRSNHGLYEPVKEAFCPINRGGHNEFSRETLVMGSEESSEEEKEGRRKRFSIVLSLRFPIIERERERGGALDTHTRTHTVGEKMVRTGAASRRTEFNDRGYLANITYHEIRERDHNVK